MNRKRIERDRKIELVSVDLARPGRLVTTFVGFSARETLAWVRREKRMFPSYRATPVFIQHENQSAIRPGSDTRFE